MRKFFTLCLLLAIFFACEKTEENAKALQSELGLNSISFFCASSGSNRNIGMYVDVTIPDPSVLESYKVYKNNTVIYTKTSPSTEKLMVLDTGSDCAGTVNPPKETYYVVFQKKDGSKITSDKYPKN